MKVIQLIRDAYLKLLVFVGTFYVSTAAMAVEKFNPGDNLAGNRNFGTVAASIDDTAQLGAGLIQQLLAIGGFIIIAISLYQLYKASKDEREKPGSAIVGMVIGALMTGAGVILWMIRNSLLGA